MSETASTKSSGPSLKLKLSMLALVACTVALAIVLSLHSSATAAKETGSANDPYALTFDGNSGSFSGEGATKQQGTVKTEPVAERDPEEKFASSCAACAKKHVVAQLPAASSTTQVAPGAPTNAQVEKAAKQQKNLFASGNKTELSPDGQAKAPLGAPDAVKAVIAAGNQIANYPYIWGGGHGSWQDSGYDCSGSVSYALKGANLVSAPIVAAQFMTYGEPGPGKYISIYASEGHVFMFVGGLRFDTSYRDGPYGTRWQNNQRPLGGFVIRHPAGL